MNELVVPFGSRRLKTFAKSQEDNDDDDDEDDEFEEVMVPRIRSLL